jgi:PAS domain S-box-containing protein
MEREHPLGQPSGGSRSIRSSVEDDRVADPAASTPLRVGSLEIDLVARAVSDGDRRLALTAKEFDLLAYLAARPGHVFSRDQLLEAVWQSSSAWQQAATVTEHIRRLRSKIEVDVRHPRIIRTVRGVGYRLDVPDHRLIFEETPARLRRLVTGVVSELTEAVIITDLEFEIRSWNASAERLYGWSEPEVLGRHILEVLQWHGDEGQLARAWAGLERHGRWQGEGGQACRDGSVVSVLSSTTVLRDEEGTPVGVVSVNRLAEVARRAAARELDAVDDALMRHGLDEDQFEAHYQPVVELRGGRVVLVEALARWNHPTLGLLEPAAFLGAAERTGLIVQIGHRVLEKACAQVAIWRQEGWDLELSVNLSTRQVADPGLVERVIEVLETSGLDPASLWLEVTETALVEELETATEVLHRLVALGIRVSIDDFGTGWASLTYLQRFPVAAIKIDGSFVAGVASDPTDTAIVRSIVSLGAELDLVVVAEGIETSAQETAVRSLGCSIGQGYLYGRPIPATAMATLRPSTQRVARS